MSKTSYRQGGQPIEARQLDDMKTIGAELDKRLNNNEKGADRAIGFVLLVFPFGTSGQCNYVSNGADRNDVIALMKEQLAAFEDHTDLDEKVK